MLRQSNVAVLREGEQSVVTHDDLAFDATLDPSGKRLVFSTARRSDYDPELGPEKLSLYAVDIDDGTETRLTRGPYDSSPDWSPDGRYVLFVRGGDSIWTVRVADRRQRKVFRLAPRGPQRGLSYIVDATWAGHGQRIAFFVENEIEGGADASFDLWTIDVDGSDRQRVLRAKDVLPGGLTWSRDGGTFAWHGHHRLVRTLFMADAADGEVRPVEPNAMAPVYSKDPSKLAYVIGHEGHYPYRIVVGDADASHPVRVPGSPEQDEPLALLDWSSPSRCPG